MAWLSNTRGRVFVGMETSGQLRRRFAARGFDVFSCDLLPADDDGDGHIVGEVFAVLGHLKGAGWWPHIAFFHPDCTYLTSSAEWAYKDPDYDRYPGVGYHQRLKPGTLFGASRRDAREEAKEQFRAINRLPIAIKGVENPVGALSKVRAPTQTVQPYELGDDASKRTCLWFWDERGNDLPAMTIDPAKRVPGRIVNGKERWANQTDEGQNRLTPGEERWKDRARTYDGIADALVEHLSWLFDRKVTEGLRHAA